jgi:hypothetical protein
MDFWAIASSTQGDGRHWLVIHCAKVSGCTLTAGVFATISFKLALEKSYRPSAVASSRW